MADPVRNPEEMGRIKFGVTKMIDQNASQQDIDSYLKQKGVTLEEVRAYRQPPPQSFAQTLGEDIKGLARPTAIAAQGGAEGLVKSLAIPLDVSGWLSRQAGLTPKDSPYPSDYAARAVDAVSGGKIEPQTPGEKLIHGSASGAGDAVGMMAPGAIINAIPRVARAVGPVVRNVLNSFATQPGGQMFVGGLGGGVTESTGNPYWGATASLLAPLAIAGGRTGVSPATVNLAPQEGRIIAAADREGVPLLPSERTGSRWQRGLEGVMTTTPGPSDVMARWHSNRQGDFNAAVMQRTGHPARDASPDTLQTAFTNIGRAFDNVQARTTLNIDQQFVNDVQNVAQTYTRDLPENLAPVFGRYMDDITGLMQAVQSGQSPQITGEIYRRIHSGLDRVVRSNQTDPQLREALGGLQAAFLDVVERTSPGPLRAEWQELRRDYQALMTVNKAMSGGTQATRSAGDIPYSGLTTAVRGADTQGYSRGRGQLNEMSRVGDYIAQKTPSSGTTERQGVMNPLYWPVMASMNALARGYTSPWGQRYLTNQVAGPTEFRALYGAEAGRQTVDATAAAGEAALEEQRQYRERTNALANPPQRR